jgi:multidrug efflux pump subunit AcrA (membrane-fusion protein)
VSFSVNSISSEKYKAKIARLAGALDTKLRSQHIEMDVVNESHKLLPGMVAEVTIPLTANTNAFIVPASAVLNSTSGVFVISIHQKTNTWVPIKSGRTYDGRTEIFGTLTSGDTILTKASEEVRNGTVINNLIIK